MNQKQNIVLDSCVVIDIIEKPKVASRLKASLRGKSVNIILCDIVLEEVNRVRKISLFILLVLGGLAFVL